jgi:regulator of sirC expression with transglutaminase-like and TPR domain
LNSPKISQNMLMVLARCYSQLGNTAKLELTLQKLTQVMPDSPEAWRDLAAIESSLGKETEAMKAVRRCLEESDKRLSHDPKAPNLRPALAGDPGLNALHHLPEFQQLTGAK